MGAGQSPTGIEPNRAAIVFAITVATLVGFAPATLVLGRLQWLVVLTALAGLTATLTLRKYSTTATEKPTMLEFILAGVGAVFPMALTGLVWLFLDWVIYRLLLLLRVSHAGSIAFWSTLPVAVVLTLVYSNGMEIAKYLYSETAGTKSAYYPLIAQRRTSLMRGVITLVAILVVVSALFLGTGHVNTWFCVFLELYLFVVGIAVLPENATSQVIAEHGRLNQIAKVFEIAGYEVERFPRTGKTEIDPLLSNLDLLTRKGDDCFAIEVKTKTEDAESAGWKIVSGLNTGAWALSDARNLPQQQIRALLMLVDVRADKSLGLVRRQESALVVSVTGEELDQLVRDADQGRIEEAVTRWTTATSKSGDLTLRNRGEQPLKRAPRGR